MKILIISEFFPTGKDLKFSGGVETRNYYISKYISKKHKITILTSRMINSNKQEKISNFTVIRVGPSRNYTATTGTYLLRLRFILSAIKAGLVLDFDVIEGTNFITHFIAKIISIYTHKPVIAWYPDVWKGHWIKISGISGIIGEILERINLTLGFDAYIAISKEVTNKLQKANVFTIPCGVQFSEFKRKIQYSYPSQILCISRLVSYKNIKTLIIAFALLSIKFPKLKLIIIGSGPEANKLMKLSSNLKINNKISFLSNLTRDQLIKQIKSSHIFSLPSKVEGFGISTLEAAAAGLPYVISNIAVHKEVTKNGKGGFLINPDAPFKLSSKIGNLIIDKSLYINKSNEAINLAKRYSWKEIAYKTEKVYLNFK